MVLKISRTQSSWFVRASVMNSADPLGHKMEMAQSLYFHVLAQMKRGNNFVEVWKLESAGIPLRA